MLAAAAQLACGVARAATGPRDPSPPQYYGTSEPEIEPETREERRERKAREMDAWLRRLVGRYSTITAQSMITGQADCVAIGDGAGVHCVLAWDAPQILLDRQEDARRRAIARGEDPPVFPDFSFWVIYQFGYDVNTSRIHFMKVGSQGGGQEFTGRLEANRMTSTAPCPGVPARAGCLMSTYVDAPPDKEYITIREYLLTDDFRAAPTRLYRLPDDVAWGPGLGQLVPEIPLAGSGSENTNSRFRTNRPR